MKATRRALVGRKIVGVEFRPFADGKGGTAHDPVLILDNGRRLYFITEETDVGEYGTLMCLSPTLNKPRVIRRG